MKVEIDLRKSLEENASQYFEKSKKAKQKLAGLQIAAGHLKSQLAVLEQKSKEKKPIAPIKRRGRDWFERFHWFETSAGFLVIGGRDAKQNTEIIKKRLEPSDLFFHADVFGAPHCVLKTKNNSAPEQSLKEAAVFAAAFSRAWQSNAPLADVYSALPEQVSKDAPAGESLGKGAFMVYGNRQWFKRTPLAIAVGVEKVSSGFRIVSGPESAIEKRALAFVLLKQGSEKKSDAAKKVFGILQKAVPEARLDLDEIMQMLPSGSFKISQ